MSAAGELEVVTVEAAILQKEEDLKGWCPASGESVGRMSPIPGSDDGTIECPDCGRSWFSGSTVLDDHDRPAFS
ncbi:hypothetical protein [Microbacterium luticocti]|uniref:hypothetical protein n=1 Tax=Microbacterium luticocti TaxID=451764 RepID=UPI00048CB4D1|nr:hypothetical protein [Microbacterium luticocti]